MKHNITKKELNKATEALTNELTQSGIILSDIATSDLGEEIMSFLTERCIVDVAPDEEAHDDSKVQIRKNRNVSCNANEEITYEIDKLAWESALNDSDGDKTEALMELQHSNKVQRIDYDSEIQEVNEEFDVNIEEI